MSTRKHDQLIALAGLFQSCQLVDELARTGKIADSAMQPLLNSLFIQNPGTTIEVYGSEDFLRPGLKLLREVLTMSNAQQNSHILRYAISVLQIAQQLRKNSKMLASISDGLESVKRRRDHLSTMHSSVISGIADLYLQTISTFKTRIQVNGFAENLQQPMVAERIRCLLFAGIRSAILWHQLGGRRWQLILNRRALLHALPASP